MAYYTTYDMIVTVLPAIEEMTTLTNSDVTAFINMAESVVDAKISRRYTVPVSSQMYSGSLLQRITTDLSLYDVMVKRVFTREKINDSQWPDRYKESMDLLDQIADGKLDLVDASGSVIGERSDQSEAWSTTQSYQPTFADGLPLEESHVDPDKTDDEEDARDL